MSDWDDGGAGPMTSGLELFGIGAIGLVPGLRSVAIYADIDPDGGGVPTDFADVIWNALADRYGKDAAR